MKFWNAWHVDGVGPCQVYPTINWIQCWKVHGKKQFRASEIININQLELNRAMNQKIHGK